MGQAHATVTRDTPARRIHETPHLAEMFSAARALEDCGVIRARWDAAGYTHLESAGLAKGVHADGPFRHFRLTADGQIWLWRNRVRAA